MRITHYLGWKARIGMGLIIISILLYALNFAIFHDSKNMFFYLSIDLAFIPIEVLLVVLVIEAAINQREKSAKMEKLNMVIGAFFSEVGTDLLEHFTEFEEDTSRMDFLQINAMWSEDDYQEAESRLAQTVMQLKISRDEDSIRFLVSAKEFLIQKRNFLLALLENPNLLEHETFTDLLQAVFHLTEELDRRPDLTNLSSADYLHLSGDTNRAYNLLIYQWLKYMEHLMVNYPYLYSLAIRTNPFDPAASAEIPDP